MDKDENALEINRVGFTERELKQISSAKYYVEQLGAYGTPFHLLLVLIYKLARLVEKSYQFRSDFWSSKN